MSTADSDENTTRSEFEANNHPRLKYTLSQDNRKFSSLAYTHKRCYTMSHVTRFFIVKKRLGDRYQSTYKYQDIRQLSKSDLAFDRSDLFLNTLDKKHELVPIYMPDLSKYKLEKEEVKEIKGEIYGLHG